MCRWGYEYIYDAMKHAWGIALDPLDMFDRYLTSGCLGLGVNTSIVVKALYQLLKCLPDVLSIVIDVCDRGVFMNMNLPTKL